MTELLFIEDGREMALALMQALATSHRITHIETGLEGIEAALTGAFDAILLDLALPDMEGIQVCEALRAAGCATPLIVLTNESHVLTKIKLLDAGANDYVTKPFSLGELKARIRAAQRSSYNLMPRDKLSVGNLTLDIGSYQATRDGQTIQLRRKEFALLECLMRHAGTVVTRTALSSHAWHGTESPWANTIDVHMKYLRDKIDKPFTEPLIRTVHGLGYKIESRQHVVEMTAPNM